MGDLFCCNLWLAAARVSPEAKSIAIDDKPFMRIHEIANGKYISLIISSWIYIGRIWSFVRWDL